MFFNLWSSCGDNLQLNQLWRYVQIHSSLSKWLGTPLCCPVGRPVEVLLSRSSLAKGITSKFYHLLQGRLAEPLLKVKGYWAQDLALDISSVEWDSCLHNVNTMFKEIGSRFIQLKIIHKWHWTLQQLYEWNLAPTDDCWRCDGLNASILHILWSCLTLQDWWENTMEVIFSVLKRFGISPKLSILGITTELSDWDFSCNTKKKDYLGSYYGKTGLVKTWAEKETPSLWGVANDDG